MTTHKLKLVVDIEDSDLSNWVVTAFEGGSNYWMGYSGHAGAATRQPGRPPERLSGEDYYKWRAEGEVGAYANPEFWNSPWRGYIVETDEGDTHFLSITEILAGLQKMSFEGRHEEVSRLLDGEYDVEDTDVLLQYALFGEVVYG